MLLSLPVAFLLVIRGPAPDSLVRFRSDTSAAATIARVGPALTARGLTLFAAVDHAANARDAGLSLPPATAFLFGSPAVGTRVMQCDLASALDLPLRILVWEEPQGAVWVGYRDPAELASRYGLSACRDVLARMASAVRALATEIAGSRTP
jgi:uncharacterized protein (DUF302 family)